MAPIMSVLTGLAASAALVLPLAAAQCAKLTPVSAPQMAAGYQSNLVANNLTSPRSLRFDSEGNLLVSDLGINGLFRLKLQDNGGLDVCVTEKKLLIANPLLNHGIELSPDGKTLYASTATEVYSYEYDAKAGTVSNATLLVTIEKQPGYHQTRTLLIPKTAPNLILVNRGSNDNLDAETADINSGRSQIRYWDRTLFNGTSVDWNTGKVLGWGLRNSVGFGENPYDGGIWSVENSLDDMTRSTVDVHNDNPGEEMNYHGPVNGTANSRLGANFGYPNCFAVWESSTVVGIQDVKVGTQMRSDLSPSNFTNDGYCQTTPLPPRLTFAAHTAPLDVKFRKDGSAAYISFHGSWDRSPPDGYRLSRIDFGADGQPKEPSTSKTAPNVVMWNANNTVCPDACFRPVGMAWDTKGRLFMSSDLSGEIFVISGA